MDLSEWLEAETGRSAALAKRFGVTPAAISHWKRNGVPVDHMKAVRDFTGGLVTLDEMVPEPDVTRANRRIVAFDRDEYEVPVSRAGDPKDPGKGTKPIPRKEWS